MEIRYAEARDIPEMLDLLLQVGEVHHRIRPDLFRAGAQKYDETALKEILADPSRPIFAAEINGKMRGYAFCILETTQDDPCRCDRRVLYIDDLCVDENHRGSGIATALYDHVLCCARELGCHAVTLNVWCGNDTAMEFYSRRGLKPQKIGMETIL